MKNHQTAPKTIYHRLLEKVNTSWAAENYYYAYCSLSYCKDSHEDCYFSISFPQSLRVFWVLISPALFWKSRHKARWANPKRFQRYQGHMIEVYGRMKPRNQMSSKKYICLDAACRSPWVLIISMSIPIFQALESWISRLVQSRAQRNICKIYFLEGRWAESHWLAALTHRLDSSAK